MEHFIINKEYVDSLRIYVYIIGFLLVGYQIHLSVKALKKTLAWNKVQSAYSMFDFKENTEILSKLSSSINNTISFKKVLTDIESEQILENIQLNNFAKEYLDDIELYCVAINSGIVDDSLAFQLYHPRFIQQFKVFEPYIKKLRTTYPLDGDVILIEFEITVNRWEGIVAQRIAEKNKKGILQRFNLINKIYKSVT